MRNKWIRCLMAVPLLLGELTIIATPALAQGNAGKEPGYALKQEKDQVHDKKVRFYQRFIPHTAPKVHQHKGTLNPHTRGMTGAQEKEHTYILKFKNAD